MTTAIKNGNKSSPPTNADLQTYLNEQLTGATTVAERKAAEELCEILAQDFNLKISEPI